MRQSGIYVIRNSITGQVYVGSAVSFQKRWEMHRWQLRRGKHHSRPLQEAWTRYGEDNFEWEVVEYVDRKVDLIASEQRWIDHYRATDLRCGYNLSPTAGSTLGVPCAPETREKIGNANRGRKHGPVSLANKRAAMNRPEVKAKLRAITRSEELRARVSRAKGGSGKVLSLCEAQEAAALYDGATISIMKLSKHYGVSYQAMRSALKGERRPKALSGVGIVAHQEQDLIRRKISKTLSGQILSPETRAKIGQSQKGRIFSEETRQRQSKSQAAYSDAIAGPMVGRRFNALTVMNCAGSRGPLGQGKRYWLCQCDCGRTTEASTTDLRSGHKKSCGCAKRRIPGRPKRRALIEMDSDHVENSLGRPQQG